MIKKLFLVVLIVVALFAGSIGWQVASAEIKNTELRDEMHDVASQLGTRIGFSAPKSDEDYSNEIVRRAGKIGIDLASEQVRVERRGSSDAPTMILTAQYTVNIGVPGVAFALHFSPTSSRD